MASRLDPGARAALAASAIDGALPMESGTPDQARAVYNASFPNLQGGRDAVAAISEIDVPTTSGRIRVRVYRGFGAPARGARALLYLHGGGWVLGNLESHDEICRWFANAAHCVVFSPDYRLAPEHKFPAGLDDCGAVLSYLVTSADAYGIDAARIGVAGDSAGGNLASVVALMSGVGRLPAIAAQLLIYPNTDAGQTAQSYQEFAEGFGLTSATMTWFRDQYVRNGDDVNEWRVSPLRAADPSAAPPAFIAIAGHDILRDEGEAYGRHLIKHGVKVVVCRWPGQIHGFVSMGRHIPDARLAVSRAVEAWDEFERC